MEIIMNKQLEKLYRDIKCLSDKQINALNLSLRDSGKLKVRLVNTLAVNDIFTISDLLSYHQKAKRFNNDPLLAINHISNISLEDIKNFLSEYDLTLNSPIIDTQTVNIASKKEELQKILANIQRKHFEMQEELRSLRELINYL